MYKRLALLALLCLMPLKAEEILIGGSESPDLKYEVYAVDNTDSGQPHLELVEASTKKPIISLGGEGYCDNARSLAFP